MTFKSKTTCFTINKVPLTTVKDAFLNSKTTCFTSGDQDSSSLKNEPVGKAAPSATQQL